MKLTPQVQALRRSLSVKVVEVLGGGEMFLRARGCRDPKLMSNTRINMRNDRVRGLNPALAYLRKAMRRGKVLSITTTGLRSWQIGSTAKQLNGEERGMPQEARSRVS